MQCFQEDNKLSVDSDRFMTRVTARPGSDKVAGGL